MHPAVVNRLIYPLHERLKGKRTHARLRELERTQWLTPAALQELQFQRLKGQLEYAYREVPYYRELLDDQDLAPHRIGSFEDFGRIPCLTKEIVQTRLADLQPRTRVRGTKRTSTGGSTGAPVTVLVDPERAAFTDATRLRAHRWFGVDMGAREIVLWGSPIEATRQDRVRTVRDWFLNSRLLSAFDLGEPALARYADIIRRHRPQKLYGYASALYLLAAHLQSRRWRPEREWPKVVFTTAEPLYEFQRAVMQSAFGCPVAIEYGCRDGGLIANECPAGGLHVPAEGIVVEVARDAAGAGPGELIVTNLDSYAMPIIRYRTGDIGELGEDGCRCGRGLPRLKRVEGRRTDFLVAPNGKVMHALAAIYILREAPGIREFQVVQEERDRLVVTIVPHPSFSRVTSDVITSRIRRLFDDAISVDIELVDVIPRPLSGKHRYVISKVTAHHLDALVAAT